MITWNPNDKSGSITLSNNDLTATSTALNSWVRAMEGKTSGKWYWEYKIESINQGVTLGVFNAEVNPLNDFACYYYDGRKTLPTAAYGTSFTTDSIVGCYLDTQIGSISFTNNGIDQGLAFIGKMYSVFYPVFRDGSSADTDSITANFGATPFDLVTRNPQLWNQLLQEGYLPYDYESSKDWLSIPLSFIKSNNKIYAFENNEWIDPNITNLTQQNFEDKGMIELNTLVTPTNKVVYTMKYKKDLDDGKIVKGIIDPSIFDNSILDIKLK